MRAHRLVPVALVVATGLACDPLQPSQPDWVTDNPDGNDDTDDLGVDSGDDDDPIGPGRTNNPPRANAGRDLFNILPGELVTLDASSSSDSDGDPLTYTWTLLSKPAGSSASVSNPTFAQAQIYVDRAGEYEAQLVVSDGRASANDTVKINVATDNGVPRANAGVDQTVNVGTTVQLSGAASSDPDGDPLEYIWTLSTPPGSGTTLSGVSIPAAAVSPTFVADQAGIFTATLEVSDGEFTSSPDLVMITARDPSSGGGGTTGGGSSSSSDCLDCGAYAEGVAMSAWTAGDLASGFGLLVMPVFVALWQRRRED